MISNEVKKYSNDLRRLGIEHELVEHPELKTPPEIAKYLGINISDTIPTLLLKVEGKYASLLRRGDCHIDFNRVKEQLEVKNARVATTEEFVNVIGRSVGAARPYTSGLDTYLDKKIFEKAYLYGGAGVFDASIKYRTADLRKIPGSKIIDVTSVLPDEFPDIKLIISQEVKDKYPGLDEIIMPVYGVNITRETILTDGKIKPFKNILTQKDFYDNPIFKAFREFALSVGHETKREIVSVENLYRRFEKSGKLPSINNIVDLCNLVALETFIPLGVFDMDQVKGDLVLRFSFEGEEFKPLAGGVEYLPAGQMVIADSEKILNHFPYQDSIYPKITQKTRNVLILGDVVAGVDPKVTELAILKTAKLVEKFAGGKSHGGVVYSQVREDEPITAVRQITFRGKSIKRKVFSGIQPTGNSHIGNYIGAISQWVKRQEDGLNVFCLVDQHAITLPQDPAVLREGCLDLAAILFAAGIDPEKSILFIQSHNPDHACLGWVLNCHLSMGQLSRMTQFKEKSQQRDFVGVGLFDYPALMAADILLYEASEVPVGEDQKQHVELARDVAYRFNSLYGETFVLPQHVIPRVGGRIMNLKDPTRKMSKSDADQSGVIRLTDSEKDIRAKIASAVTDSGKEIVFDETNKPGISNLMAVYSNLKGLTLDEVEKQFAGKSYVEFKKVVADVVVSTLIPLQKRYYDLRESGEIYELLKKGAEKARAISGSKLREVYEKIGFVV